MLLEGNDRFQNGFRRELEQISSKRKEEMVGDGVVRPRKNKEGWE
jgi:hypothetical protein